MNNQLSFRFNRNVIKHIFQYHFDYIFCSLGFQYTLAYQRKTIIRVDRITSGYNNDKPNQNACCWSVHLFRSTFRRKVKQNDDTLKKNENRMKSAFIAFDKHLLYQRVL